MTNPTTVRRRLDHVQAIIDTTEEHIDSPGDQYALMRACGLLEQAVADLEEMEAERAGITEADDAVQAGA